MLSHSNSQFLQVQHVSSASWRSGVTAWLKTSIFRSCLVVIAAISAYDAWLIFEYRNVVHDLERNEICMFLINLEPKFMSMFIAGKAAGTVAVLTSLAAIWKYNQKMAFVSATAVSIFQMGLLWYLTMADFDMREFLTF